MITLRLWQRLAGALSLIFVLAATAWAVDVNGRIKGTVTDPSGAVLPGVKITATNLGTGVKYTADSGADGTYLFPQLPVTGGGLYSISASAPNFKAFTATGIKLVIDQEYVENITMQVGSTGQTVQVNAAAVQVDTTDMQLSNVVNSEQMEELPLINRSFTGLELTLPGVQASSDRFGSNYSVSGAQTQQSEYLINGADTNDVSLNTIAIQPNLDAIDQFNLIDGPLNAEYDRNSGGIVSATIKQGTNHIHGDAFEFYRDTFLNTANWYQTNLKTGVKTPSKFHQNIPGATVGGPILRDKIFFFFAFQGTWQITPQTGGNPGVLSNAERGGDFSVDAGKLKSTPIPGTIVIPGCTAGMTWAQCGAAVNYKFPTSAFNPVSTTLINKFLPTPNAGTYLYNFNPVTAQTIKQYIGRLDFAMNPRNQIYGLVINQHTSTTDTLPFTGATVPGFGDRSTLSINQFTVDYIHDFSSTLVNDLAAHYTRFNYDAVEPQSAVAPSTVGFAITPENTKGEGLPAVTITGQNGVGFELGFSTNGPQPRIDQAIQLDDSISKVLGKHVLKFGYEGERFNVTNPFSARNNGSYSFNSTSSNYTSGDGALDFVLGVPGSYSQGTGAVIQADAFLNYLYGQDQWKLTNSFTLNYGLAYSIDTPLRAHQYGGEGIACFVNGFNSTLFVGAPTDIAYPGEGGCKNTGQATTRYDEFGPRVGFAWAPSLGWLSGGDARKFAVRGGLGIYYDRTEEESSLQTLETPPFGLNSSGVLDYPTGNAPAFGNPYEDVNTGQVYASKFPFTFPTKGTQLTAAQWKAVEPMGISTYGPSFRAPYAENFQIGVERQLPSQILARLSYVGSLARHNQSAYESDYITAAGHAACVADTVQCGNPTVTKYRNQQPLYFPSHTIGNDASIRSVGTVGSFANSNYNSLQVLVQKGATHGLTFIMAYTYAHAIDSGSSFENSGFGGSNGRGWNQFYKPLNYGDSAYDARNRFVLSPLYIVPKFSGPAYTLKNVALAGWEVSGIITLAQGFPYDISYGGGTSSSMWCASSAYFYACPDVPEQLAPIATGNLRTRQAGTGYSAAITNASAAFAPEPLGTFGNVHRDPYHGPGINNTNVVLAKNFYLSTERNIWFQMRMESDNVFNHTQFNNPDGNYSHLGSTFGNVTSAAAARQSQLALRILF